MEPIELTARREALGLTIAGLAKHLEIRESNLARWEGGTYEPRDWDWIDEALERLERYQDEEYQRLRSLADEEGLEGEGPTGRIRTYGSNGDLWSAHACAKQLRIPAVVHRTAAARAAVAFRADHGKPADIETA
ncbi:MULTISPECIES: helix-turn-helix domain-containing protein [Citricoccus]|uniref:helix-turn-helix domain-containing protein n=1 Tax=Citricoccus TaxID=169133 RepID=UPI000255F120|nr:helix-turn-helix domain-containing protein [Citricoccus sp. CH26A]